jgi:hypothetical protein
MKSLLTLILGLFCLVNVNDAYAGNLHLIDADEATGFSIYRTGAPDREDMKEFCRLGIQEIMVLSGTASKHEYKYQAECPTLKVIYNTKGNSRVPLTKEFLNYFDNWVQEAKATGKKIAFRCTCGCHRTGRLAAYYQMKYQGITADDAKSIMTARGKWMWLMPHLYPQVSALNDYINGRGCSTRAKYCVTE